MMTDPPTSERQPAVTCVSTQARDAVQLGVAADAVQLGIAADAVQVRAEGGAW